MKAVIDEIIGNNRSWEIHQLAIVNMLKFGGDYTDQINQKKAEDYINFNIGKVEDCVLSPHTIYYLAIENENKRDN